MYSLAIFYKIFLERKYIVNSGWFTNNIYMMNKKSLPYNALLAAI